MYKMFHLFRLPILFFACWVCFSCSNNSGSAHLQPEVQKAIDSVFSEIEDGDAPGISALLWYDGKIAYQTHKGLANMESGAKIDANTAFNIGQISDQFAAYGILKLAQEDKLDMQENLNTYLRTSSKLLDSVSIIHLLSHSSGLYDISVLNQLMGGNLASPTSVMELITKQKKFSFRPGTDFVLSRTNIFLLERILETVSGVPLAQFMSEQIFQPVGLDNTFYEKAPNDAIHVALPYELEEGDHIPVNETADVFDSKVFSSVNDLLKWELFLNDTGQGKDTIVEMLNTVATLQTGKEFNRPVGKLTLGQRFINAERGISELYNTGEQSGFASSIFRFPTADFISIIMTNNGMDYSGYFGIISSYELMGDQFPEPASTDFANLPQLELNRNQLEAYSGKFWDEQGEFVRDIQVLEDTLRYIRSAENRSALLPIAKDTFQMVFPYDEVILVTFSNQRNGGREMNYIISDADPIPFEEIVAENPGPMDLDQIVGTYRNPIFGITFDITTQNDSIVLSGSNDMELVYGFVMEQLFVGGDWFLQSITFQENENQGGIEGFTVNNPALNKLFFQRQIK